MGINHLLEFGVAERANSLIDYGAALEQQERRDAADLVAVRGVVVGNHVQLTDFNFT